MAERNTTDIRNLNVGCGFNILDGYINVDKERSVEPDVCWNIEVVPWPWSDSTFDNVLFNHCLEHVGQSPDVFLNVMTELYRVCVDGAHVWINVPHPQHDNFTADPTHVRPITPFGLSLFDKSLNQKWKNDGVANSCLGLYLDVDFRVESVQLVLDAAADREMKLQKLNQSELDQIIRTHRNIVAEFKVTLRVVK